MKIRWLALMGCFLIFAAISPLFGQIASGGVYVLTRSSIPNGGGSRSGGTFSLNGSAGQSAAGANPGGGTFGLRSGFWIPLAAPSAASASIAGTVTGPGGAGLRNVEVSVSGGSLTAPLIVRTNQFGMFRFDNIEVGESYIVTVSSRRYAFGQDSQIVTLIDNVIDLSFVATGQQ